MTYNSLGASNRSERDPQLPGFDDAHPTFRGHRQTGQAFVQPTSPKPDRTPLFA
jgi:hypothetical protein